MIKIGTNTIVPQTCGVSVLGLFRDDEISNPAAHWPSINTVEVPAGCGWVMAGFTSERPDYAKAYKELTAKWPIVYQSPRRRNSRTGNMFFFAIFDTKGKV